MPIALKPDDRSCTYDEASHPVNLSEHVLVSDSEGRIPADRHGGDFATAFRTIMGGYAKAKHNDKARPRLLFYFNGGLNSQAEVEQQAVRQIPCMEADGYYPVFFVWNTEFFDSYREQTIFLQDGQRSNSILTWFLAPLRWGGDVISGLATSGDNFLKREWPDSCNTSECLFKVRDVNPACPLEYQVFRSGDTDSDLPQPVSHVIASTTVDQHCNHWLATVGEALLLPARLISSPLAQGFGATGWNNYLRRTRTTVRRAAEFNFNTHANWDRDESGDAQAKLPASYGDSVKAFPRGLGVFAMFFETLLQFQWDSWPCWLEEHQAIWGQTESAKSACATVGDAEIAQAVKESKIVLIGHSMGGIVINGLVERFPDLHLSDIVVMASAASTRETRRVMDRYYEQRAKEREWRERGNADAKAARHLAKRSTVTQPSAAEAALHDGDAWFYSLMLHPYNDRHELTAVGLVPQGSLLYWVDTMYEEPKTPEDKTFGYWPTANSARRMFGRATQLHSVFKVFDREARDKAVPTRHGDFNDDRTYFWRPSFWGATSVPGLAQRYTADLPARALSAP